MHPFLSTLEKNLLTTSQYYLLEKIIPPPLHSVETATNSYSSKQDLPNNMIHQVPIKSLPQEWLWCETWCDDSSKKRAKTIDLVSAVWLPHSHVTLR